MQNIQRFMVNIFSDDLKSSQHFYQSLFKLDVAFESDWFVQLCNSKRTVEIGLLKKDHDSIPKNFQASPSGGMMTFVVESADEIHTISKNRGFTIVEGPRDMPYGQRRMLLQDPDGMLLDVSSLIPNFQY